MDYKTEDKEDKKYKKGYGREEFKKDVADAVKGPPKSKRKKKGKIPAAFAQEIGPKSTKGGKGGKSAYAKMGVGELRKLLNTKKKALLVKSGFPDGTIPRSKAAMISLCVKLKRKRW
jgi:hypothetical protein